MRRRRCHYAPGGSPLALCTRHSASSQLHCGARAFDRGTSILLRRLVTDPFLSAASNTKKKPMLKWWLGLCVPLHLPSALPNRLTTVEEEYTLRFALTAAPPLTLKCEGEGGGGGMRWLDPRSALVSFWSLSSADHGRRSKVSMPDMPSVIVGAFFMSFSFLVSLRFLFSKLFLYRAPFQFPH